MDDVDAVGQILKCGAVFYARFGFIDKYKPTNYSRSLTSDLFSIASTVVEIDDLGDHPVDRAELISRVFDSIFRGRRDHILACIAALSRAKMLKVEPRTQRDKTAEGPKAPSGAASTQPKDAQTATKVAYRFSAEYFEFLEVYIRDVYKTVTEQDLRGDWLTALRLVFDFYKFRYIPEWFLLMRRILRSSRLDEAAKKTIRENLFSDSDTWTNINQYLKWSQGREHPQQLLRREFRAALDTELGADSRADARIRALTELGFCEVDGNRLVVRVPIRQAVLEYEDALKRSYNGLRKDLIPTRLTPDSRPPPAPGGLSESAEG